MAKNLKMKKLILFLIILLIFLGMSGCENKSENIENNINQPPTVLGDIAYDVNKDYGYRVYIKEDDKYCPYLVLTNDYNGNCLLLREYLLNEFTYYNLPGEYGSYYKNSHIDEYLNNVYYQRLSDDLKDIIINSQIEITTKNAIDTHKKETEIISRKIFLLSANEVNSGLAYIPTKEGPVLSYFKNIENRIALHEDGKADSWMIRTPALEDGNTVIAVGYDGSIGVGGINGLNEIYESSVRPAFCLSNETRIVQRDDIIDGQSIFCIQI